MRNCSKDWSRSEQEFTCPLLQARSEARIVEHIGHVAAPAAGTGLIDRDPPAALQSLLACDSSKEQDCFPGLLHDPFARPFQRKLRTTAAQDSRAS
jgi:hypothetical protein